MQAIDAIKTRRSIRAYDTTKPVTREILSDLVDCARLAPSAMNQQLWEFVVVTDRKINDEIAATIGHAKFLTGIPATILVLCRNNSFYLEDASAATQNILIAARAHGLGSCWVAVDKQSYHDAIRALIAAPADYKVVALVSVGYPAETPNPEKRPLSSVLHWERF